MEFLDDVHDVLGGPSQLKKLVWPRFEPLSGRVPDVFQIDNSFDVPSQNVFSGYKDVGEAHARRELQQIYEHRQESILISRCFLETLLYNRVSHAMLGTHGQD